MGCKRAYKNSLEQKGKNKWICKTNLLCSSSFCDSQRDAQNGVGSQLGFVWGTVKLNQEFVDLGLFSNVEVLLNHGRGNDLVNVLDGFEDTLASPFGFIPIAELYGFVLTCLVNPLSLSPNNYGKFAMSDGTTYQ